MSNEIITESAQERIARLAAARRAARGEAEKSAPAAQAVAPSTHSTSAQLNEDLMARFADAVPNVSGEEEVAPGLTPSSIAEGEIDAMLANTGILDAYAQFCGKMVPSVAPGQTESIMISCPNLSHPDKNPSAWANTENNFWYCAKCEGGDVIDLIGATMGFSSKAERRGVRYHDIKRHYSARHGYTTAPSPNGGAPLYVSPAQLHAKESELKRAEERLQEVIGEAKAHNPEPTPLATVTSLKPPVAPALVPDAPAQPDTSNVVSIHSGTEKAPDLPDLDWRAIFTEDSFIKTFMEAASTDDVPEMYHLAHALVGVGMTMGREVTLQDAPQVYANLLVCVLGRSGLGKSKSRGYIDEIIHSTIPGSSSGAAPTGVKMIASPSSGEGLISAFRHHEKISGKATGVVVGGVRAIVDYGELSALTNRAARMGNTLKDHILEFYDCKRVIGFTNKADGSFEAHDAFASIVTTSQPDKLPDLLDRGDNVSGFLNRWSFFTGTPKRKVALFGTSIDLTAATSEFQDIAVWASYPRAIEWDDDAIEAWTAWFYGTLEPLREADHSDIIMRSDLYLKKLVLICTANLKTATVTRRAVEQALMFWDYTLACYRLVDSSVGVPAMNLVEEAMLHCIVTFQNRQGRFITKGVLNNRLRRHNLSSKDFLQAISNLIALGKVREHEDTTGKGPTTQKYQALEDTTGKLEA